MRCTTLQKEQREELKGLIKKYGQTWEPWKSELKKHKGEGKEYVLSVGLQRDDEGNNK